MAASDPIPGRAPLSDRFAAAMGALLGPGFPGALGLAVSGGGDSVAMLHLAAGWARVWGVGLRVVTVDHGLRPEAAAEAAMVADEARGLGLSHDTLRWGGWDGRGNLQDAARRARLDLIGRWRSDISHVLFAHTEDDQAETFLMRLRRGSGVEGLGAMRPLRRVEAPEGAWWVVRPMLEMRRAELRHYLGVLRIPFADDPSNDDPAYDRVRMRRLLDVLEEEGLGRTVLSVTAARMRRAAEALGRRAADVAARIAASEAGDLLFDRDALAAVEEDTRLRLLAAALHMVGGGDYRPRAVALEDAADRAMSGGAATLAGCRIVAEWARIRVFREHAAVASLVAPASPGAIWDGRWRITGPGLAGGEIRALGEAGLALCPDWRDSGLPRASLEATPAIWAGQRLVAAPVARSGGDWRAAPVKDHSAFIAFLLAH